MGRTWSEQTSNEIGIGLRQESANFIVENRKFPSDARETAKADAKLK